MSRSPQEQLGVAASLVALGAGAWLAVRPQVVVSAEAPAPAPANVKAPAVPTCSTQPRPAARERVTTIPASSAPTCRAATKLDMWVTSVHGRPLAGALCTAITLDERDAETAPRARTAVDGRAALPLPASTVAICVEFPQHATFWQPFDAAACASRNCPSTIHATLWPSGSLHVRLYDENGNPCGDHPLELHWLGGELDGRAWSVADAEQAGMQVVVRATTDARGTAVTDTLLPGRWSAVALPWRAHERTGIDGIAVSAHAATYAEIAVLTTPAQCQATGQVDLPHASSVGGIVLDYDLEVEGQAIDAPIYADGRFFLFGQPGQRLRVRAVARDQVSGDARASAWWDMTVGSALPGVVRPTWSR